MKLKKLLSLALCVLLIVSVFTGCGKKEEEKVIKIGVMQFGEFDALQNAYKGFVDGLAEAGYVDGENIKINYLSAAADTSNCPSIADTLINDGSDLIFAIATPSVAAIKEKTSTIPVVFTAVTDPVGSGLVASNDAPGANITGMSDLNPVAAQIDMIKDLLPEAKTVAVCYCSSESNSYYQYTLAKAEIEKLGMTCVEKTISQIDEAKAAVESLKGVADAIYVPTDNTIADGMATFSQVATECGLPIICGEAGMVKGGGTATFGVDYYNLGKDTAAMAVKILEADDPVAAAAAMPIGFQVEGCKYAINKAVCTQLGITVPQAILDVADIFE